MWCCPWCCFPKGWCCCLFLVGVVLWWLVVCSFCIFLVLPSPVACFTARRAPRTEASCHNSLHRAKKRTCPLRIAASQAFVFSTRRAAFCGSDLLEQCIGFGVRLLDLPQHDPGSGHPPPGCANLSTMPHKPCAGLPTGTMPRSGRACSQQKTFALP